MSHLLPRLGFVALCLLAPLQAQNVGEIRETGIAPAVSAPLSTFTRNLSVLPGEFTVDLRNHFTIPGVNAEQLVQLQTNIGTINVELLVADAPNTVANFRKYLATSSTSQADLPKTYDNTIIHRSVPGFVIQGGGFRLAGPLPALATQGTVNNEFKVANTRGTIAMAKLDNLPNSATSQWFINLADNRGSLDNVNGGYTVFARVLGGGMTLADQVAGFEIYNLRQLYPFLSPALNEVPLFGIEDDQEDVFLSNFVTIQSARAVPLQPPATGTGASVLTYSVTNSSPGFVTATITNGRLRVVPARFGGRATLTVRATEGGGAFAESSFSLERSGVPVIFENLPALTTAPVGTALNLPAKVSAWPAATITWERRPRGSSTWAPIEPGDLFALSDNGTLTVRLDAADSAAALALSDDQFRYRAVSTLGTAVSRVTTLRVLRHAFTAVTPETIPLPGLVAQNGRTFILAGLPRGLVFDPATRSLVGAPAVAPGVYRITVTIRDNGLVTGTRVYYVELKPLVGNNVGGFEAFLGPIDAPPLAKLQLLVSADGNFTGTLATTVEPQPLALRGTLVRSTTGVLRFTGDSLVVPRPGLPAGRAYLLSDLAIGTDGRFSVRLLGRESAAATPVELATALLVTDPTAQNFPGNPGVRLLPFARTTRGPWANVNSYNFAITTPALLAGGGADARPIPAGSGYAIVPVSTDGRLSFRGKLADGTPFTALLAGGSDLGFRLFLRPYGGAPGAYFSAYLPLSVPNPDFPRHSIRGQSGRYAFWAKPAQARSANYRDGFGPLRATVKLEPWYPGRFADFGIVETTNATRGRIDPVFSGAALGASAAELPSALASTYALPVAALSDFAPPDASAFAGKLDTRNGFFSGSFLLKDPLPGSTALITRKVIFEGTLFMSEVQQNGTINAEGFTLVPALPGAVVSTPASGRIQLKQPGTPPAP